MRVAIPANRPARTVQKPIWKKLGWFIGIWIASILSLAVVAYGIKMMLR